MIIYKPKRPSMAKLIPPSQCRTVKVVHHKVTEDEARWHRLQAAFNGEPYGYTRPGTYAILRGMNGDYRTFTWMSDTDMEWITNRKVLREARGDVVIFGLGLGFILHPIMQKKEVKSIRVIEMNKDVIKLIGKHVTKWRGHRKVSLVHGDAFKVRLDPRSADVVYFDIWPNISSENLASMRALKKQHRAALRPDGWMGCWREAKCRMMAAEDRREDAVFAAVGGRLR